MTSKLDEVFKRVLNDTAIFDSRYDKKQKERIPKLFEGENWQELGKLFREREAEEALRNAKQVHQLARKLIEEKE